MPAAVSPTFENLETRLLMSHVHPAAKAKNPKAFVESDLIADVAGVAASTDPQLINAWGLAAGAAGPFWVNANGSNLSRGVFNGTTAAPAGVPRTITVPKPTGIVFNSNANAFKFPDSGSGQNKAADYLIASENGKIYGWTAPTDGSATTPATVVVDSSGSGAIYTGLTIGRNFGAPTIYAANFASGRVDVFDQNFSPVDLSTNTVRPAFTDNQIPAGYAPYNVATIGPNILVTYALRDAAGTDSVKALGAGFVALFTAQGQLLRHFSNHSTLNAPWGVAVAPSGFGKFSNDILIGNFGDGTINAFSSNGKFRGQLTDVDHNVISIDGLWGLSVGNNGLAGSNKTLFFAAGPADETHGLFGKIDFKRVKTAGTPT